MTSVQRRVAGIVPIRIFIHILRCFRNANLRSPDISEHEHKATTVLFNLTVYNFEGFRKQLVKMLGLKTV